jgi:hypothetical protein
MFRPLLICCVISCLTQSPVFAEEKKPAAEKEAATASKPTASSQPSGDPTTQLKEVVPKNKLPPLRSVRLRDKREEEDRSRKGTISVTITSSPKGAAIYYGGKLLGNTPLTLTAQRGSTPFDVVLRRGGYMTLRTRIMRKVSHTYSFKLTPAKFQ